jgi:hypothetical protein
VVSAGADPPRLATVTEIFPGAGDHADEDDAVEALLRAQHGYQAAVHAVDAARLPSLTDFLA